MKKKINYSVEEAIRAINVLKEEKVIRFIEKTSEILSSAFSNKNKLLAAGNGGSLCDAMHVCEEFSGYYRNKRAALSALVLADPGHMSCVANDTGYEYVFSRGIEALGQPGDVFIALSTSGNSQNLINAVLQAKKQKLATIAFLGKTGGAMKGLCDLEWIVEGFNTSDRIQEAHMTALHIVVEMVEQQLFYANTEKKISVNKTQPLLV